MLDAPLHHLMLALKEFSVQKLLDDYHHLIFEHPGDPSCFQHQCPFEKCPIWNRFCRDRSGDSNDTIRRSLYGGEASDQVIFLQLLDEMHMYVYHHMEVAVYQKVAARALVESSRKAKALWATQHVVGPIHHYGLFADIGINGGSCSGRGLLLQFVSRQPIDPTVVHRLHRYLIENEMDSDCIAYDMLIYEEENISNLWLAAQRKEDIIQMIRTFVRRHTPYDVYLSNIRPTRMMPKSLRLWTHHKFVDTVKKEDDSRYSVVQSSHFGLVAKTSPRYGNLKEEVLSDTVFAVISRQIWRDIRQRCQYLVGTAHARSLTADEQSLEELELTFTESIGIHHLKALFIWSTFPQIQYAIKNYCRTVDFDRNRIRHFLRTLLEAVGFSDQRFPGDVRLFYGGMTPKVLFDRFHLNIMMPQSFTASYSIAEMNLSAFDGEQQGIILTLSDGGAASKYIDVQWLSTCAEEKEVLFVGGSVYVVDIVDSHHSYQNYVIAMLLFQLLYRGDDLLGFKQMEGHHEYILIHLMESYMEQIGHNSGERQAEFDSYIQHLFASIIKRLTKEPEPIYIDRNQLQYVNRKLARMWFDEETRTIGLFSEFCRKASQCEIHIFQSAFIQYDRSQLVDLMTTGTSERMFDAERAITMPLDNNLVVHLMMRLGYDSYEQRMYCVVRMVNEEVIGKIKNLTLRYKIEIEDFAIRIDEVVVMGRDASGGKTHTILQGFGSDEYVPEMKVQFSVVCLGISQ